jgi:ribonucleoside-diphosphate reductase alpha chain
VSFDKITTRIQHICSWKLESNSKNNILTSDWCDPITSIDPIDISKKICARIYNGIDTSELDAMSAELCAAMSTNHPDYSKLASTDVIRLGNENKDAIGVISPLYDKSIAEFILQWSSILDTMIIYDRDYDIDFFGFKTLQRSYLFKANGNVIERPQHMWMRVAVCLHAPHNESWYSNTIDAEDERLIKRFELIKETYDSLSF